MFQPGEWRGRSAPERVHGFGTTPERILVPPSERAGALAFTGTLRGVAQAIGPAVAGIANQSAAFGAPFLLAGIPKITYDVGLYAAFARRPADHEMRAP